MAGTLELGVAALGRYLDGGRRWPPSGARDEAARRKTEHEIAKYGTRVPGLSNERYETVTLGPSAFAQT
jgi:hypothetical protein